ncbi:MAG: amidohydrolase family protein [Myxococcota bacterium]|nr:amidohydrolase family protein [Myxococcota bacterium]
MPPSPTLENPLFDSDQHYYEPRDCFTRFMARKDMAKAIQVKPDSNGQEKIWVGDKPFTFLDWNFDRYAKPGALREMLKLMKTPDYQNQVVEEVQPEYLNRSARIRKMDDQGLDSCLLFPTLAVCVEHFMRDDPEQMYLNFHAFNEWLDTEWGFGREGRLFGVPLLSLLDLDRAVQELEWLLSRGARVISMRAGPAFGRSPADPYFDPIWSRLNEARVPVAYHVGEAGYNEMMSPFWGEDPNPSSHRQSAFQWTNLYGDRPIMDTVSALVFNNLFGRFPDLQIMSIENGSGWVNYILKAMDKMGGMGYTGPWIGGRIKEKPSAILKRHLSVSPFHEENVEELCQRLGPDRVLFGSDYPHPEGLAEPTSFQHEIENLPRAEQELVMSSNGRRLLGFA